MTFVPSPKLDLLSSTYSDRLLTSSAALSSTASANLLGGGLATSSTNFVVSSTRPLTITTRFEAFSCKKVASSKFAAAAKDVPSFNQPSTSSSSFQNISNNAWPSSLNPLTEDDSQGAEEERELLSGVGASYSSFSAGVDQGNNTTTTTSASSASNSMSDKMKSQEQSSFFNNNNNNLVSSEVFERLVPITAAIMDAKYALDGYGFEGELKPQHVCVLDAESWFKLVCAMTIQSHPSLSSLTAGPGNNNNNGNNTSSSTSGVSISNKLTADGSAGINTASSASGLDKITFSGFDTPSSSLTTGGDVSSLSYQTSSAFSNADAKQLWKAFSEILTGSNEEISSTFPVQPSSSASSNATNNNNINNPLASPSSLFPDTAPSSAHHHSNNNNNHAGHQQQASSPFPDASPLKASEILGVNLGLHNINNNNITTHIKSPNTSTNANGKTNTPTHSSSATLIPLNHASLVFFRLNAPDLDPQRKIGGMSLRSAAATPAGVTPIGIVPSFTSSGGARPPRGAFAPDFPSAPGNLNHLQQQASHFGTRRDRDGNDVVGMNDFGAMMMMMNNNNNGGASALLGNGDSLPQSPNSMGPGGFPSGVERDVSLSEHLFVYHKKTKMCVAVMTCGK